MPHPTLNVSSELEKSGSVLSLGLGNIDLAHGKRGFNHNQGGYHMISPKHGVCHRQNMEIPGSLLEVSWRLCHHHVTGGISGSVESRNGEARYSHGGDHSWRCLRTGELTLGTPLGCHFCSHQRGRNGFKRDDI